jgi:hypothetical protein
MAGHIECGTGINCDPALRIVGALLGTHWTLPLPTFGAATAIASMKIKNTERFSCRERIARQADHPYLQ